MQINEKINELGKKLPYGSYAKISKATGLRFNTVSDFFQMKHKPSSRIIKLIMPIANEIIEESFELINKN